MTNHSRYAIFTSGENESGPLRGTYPKVSIKKELSKAIKFEVIIESWQVKRL